MLAQPLRATDKLIVNDVAVTDAEAARIAKWLGDADVALLRGHEGEPIMIPSPGTWRRISALLKAAAP